MKRFVWLGALAGLLALYCAAPAQAEVKVFNKSNQTLHIKLTFTNPGRPGNKHKVGRPPRMEVLTNVDIAPAPQRGSQTFKEWSSGLSDASHSLTIELDCKKGDGTWGQCLYASASLHGNFGGLGGLLGSTYAELSTRRVGCDECAHINARTSQRDIEIEVDRDGITWATAGLFDPSRPAPPKLPSPACFPGQPC